MGLPRTLVAVLAALTACARPPQLSVDRVLNLETLSSTALASLDPATTAFILQSAPLEAHGPHLPIGSDSYQGMYSAKRMAQVLSDSLPGWSIILVPPLWFGIDGANRIAARDDVLGTFSLRPTTLRAIAADLGTELADRGFRWLFLVHVHGAPLEHIALSDAADFVRETRGMGMFNIGSLEYMANDSVIDAMIARRLTAADRARIGFDLHAGFAETSTILAARPDLVTSQLRSVPDVTVGDWQSLLETARRREWQGYWSAPSLADSAVGRQILDSWAMRWTRLALLAIRGEDLSKFPRFPDGLPDSPITQMSLRTLSRQRDFDRTFGAWLSHRGSLIDR